MRHNPINQRQPRIRPLVAKPRPRALNNPPNRVLHSSPAPPLDQRHTKHSAGQPSKAFASPHKLYTVDQPLCNAHSSGMDDIPPACSVASQDNTQMCPEPIPALTCKAEFNYLCNPSCRCDHIRTMECTPSCMEVGCPSYDHRTEEVFVPHAPRRCIVCGHIPEMGCGCSMVTVDNVNLLQHRVDHQKNSDGLHLQSCIAKNAKNPEQNGDSGPEMQPTFGVTQPHQITYGHQSPHVHPNDPGLDFGSENQRYPPSTAGGLAADPHASNYLCSPRESCSNHWSILPVSGFGEPSCSFLETPDESAERRSPVDGQWGGGKDPENGGHLRPSELEERRSPNNGSRRRGCPLTPDVLKTQERGNADAVLGPRCPHRRPSTSSAGDGSAHGEQFLVTSPWHPTLMAKTFELPLYTKGVAKLSWPFASALIAENMSAPIQQAWHRLVDMFDETRALPRIFHDSDVLAHARTISNAHLSEEDVAHLVEKGLLQSCAATEATCKSFSVIEAAKHRRRWILWPQAFNEAEDWSSMREIVQLPSLPNQLLGVRHKCASCIDFTAFFQQMPIAESRRIFFTLRHNGKSFSATTVPTGGSRPPWIAQILTTAILECACRRCNIWDCLCQAYIDNIRVAGDHEKVVKIMKAIFDICQEVGITITESWQEAQPLKSYCFLGVVYNHDDCTVSLSDRTKTKLRNVKGFLHPLLSQETPVLWRAIQSSLAKCLWASTVVCRAPGRELAFMYHVIKFARRRASSFAASTQDASVLTTIWPSVIAPWILWCEKLIDALPTTLKESDQTSPCVTMYTDASLSGYGAVMMFEGISSTPSILAAPWLGHSSKTPNINVLEIRAVRLAIQTGNFPLHSKISLFIDNTSALYSLRKERSASFGINEEIKKILSICQSKSISFESINYIKSADNPADSPSRLFSHLLR